MSLSARDRLMLTYRRIHRASHQRPTDSRVIGAGSLPAGSWRRMPVQRSAVDVHPVPTGAEWFRCVSSHNKSPWQRASVTSIRHLFLAGNRDRGHVLRLQFRHPYLVSAANQEHMAELGTIVGELWLAACLPGETPDWHLELDEQQVRHRVAELIRDRCPCTGESRCDFPMSRRPLLRNAKTFRQHATRQAYRLDERPPRRDPGSIAQWSIGPLVQTGTRGDQHSLWNSEKSPLDYVIDVLKAQVLVQNHPDHSATRGKYSNPSPRPQTAAAESNRRRPTGLGVQIDAAMTLPVAVRDTEEAIRAGRNLHRGRR